MSDLILSTYFNLVYDDIDLWDHCVGSIERRASLTIYVSIDIAKPKSLERDSSIIVIESTAHYGNNLVKYPVANYYKFYVITSIQTSTIRKKDIRKMKKENVDTFIIAKTLMMQTSYQFYILLAFSVLDTSIYQSGNFSAKKTGMSKRKFRALRYALICKSCHKCAK